MLLEEFLIPMGLTHRELADAPHVPYQRINDIQPAQGHPAEHGFTSGEVLWHLARFLAESTAPLGSLSGSSQRNQCVGDHSATHLISVCGRQSDILCQFFTNLSLVDYTFSFAIIYPW